MAHVLMNTPLGPLTLFDEGDALVALEWGRAPEGESTPLLERARAELDAYFDGALTRFETPVRPSGTEFQQRVWQELLGIPYGACVTYGQLATRLSTAPRAVARACAGNPIPILIPCHRVIGAGGRLGGYSGGDGIDTKRALLRLEGALSALTPDRDVHQLDIDCFGRRYDQSHSHS